MADETTETYSPYKSPDGEVVNIPESYLAAFVNMGYAPATPEEVESQRRVNAYKDMGGIKGALVPATAALSSASQGLTLGAFNPLLENFAPETYQTMQEIQRAAPTATDVGVGAGIAGSLFAPVGKLIEPLGAAAKGATTAALSGAPKAVGAIAGTAAKLGTEGLALAAPQAAAQAIAGKTDDAAETLLYSGGLSALLGAAGQTGAELFGAGKAAGKIVAEKAKEILPENIGSIARQRLTEAKESEIFKALGGQKSIRNDPRIFPTVDDFKEFAKFADDKVLSKGFFHSKDKLAQDAISLKNAAGAEMGIFLEDVTNTGFRASKTSLEQRLIAAKKALPPEHTYTSARKIYNNVIKDLKNIQAEGYSLETGAEDGVSLKRLFDFKKSFKEGYKAKDPSMPSNPKVYRNIERDVDAFIMQELDRLDTYLTNNPEEAIDQAVSANFFSRFKQLKSDYKNWARMQPGLDNLINMSANKTMGLGDYFMTTLGSTIGMSAGGLAGGLAGGALGYIVNEAKDMYGSQLLVRGLKATEKVLNNKNNALASAADKLMSVTEKGRKALATFPRANSSAIPRGIAAFNTRSVEQIANEKDPNKAIDKIVEHLQNIVSNPEAAVGILPQASQGYDAIDPNTAMAAQQKAQQAAQALLQIAPKRASRLSPFDDVPGYSRSERDDFQNALNVAIDPLAAVQDLVEGTLDPASVDIMRQIYPVLFADTQKILLSKAASTPDAAVKANGKKLSLSLLFGTHVDSLYDPASVQILQQSFAPAEQNPKPTRRNVQQDLLSAGQRLENR